MYALSMYEEYLIDILKGIRPCDVRLHSTNKRGRIALLKSKTNLIYGYVDFVSVEQITYDDYVLWHVGKNYTLDKAYEEIEFNKYQEEKKFKRAYMYNFKNPVIFEIPKKITVIKKTGSWVLFDETKVLDGYKQESLFKRII